MAQVLIGRPARCRAFPVMALDGTKKAGKRDRAIRDEALEQHSLFWKRVATVLLAGADVHK